MILVKHKLDHISPWSHPSPSTVKLYSTGFHSGPSMKEGKERGSNEGSRHLHSSCDAPSSLKSTRSHLRFYTACWHTYTPTMGCCPTLGEHQGPSYKPEKPFSKKGDSHLAVHFLISRLPVPWSVGLPHLRLGSTCSLVQAC